MNSNNELKLKKEKRDERLQMFYKNLDRSLFIDNEYKTFAGIDRALPIGYDQTISQPSLVYKMTSILTRYFHHLS